MRRLILYGDYFYRGGTREIPIFPLRANPLIFVVKKSANLRQLFSLKPPGSEQIPPVIVIQ